MGLLTSGGYLVRKSGLSAWASGGCDAGECQLGCSPPTTPFIDPLRIPPILPERPVTALSPAPQECPNNAINPATRLPFEGRGQFNGVLRPGTDCFQFFKRFPPESFFISRMRENARFRITSDPHIPDQTIWGFNLGGNDPAITPGPTIVDQYGGARIVRRFNELPPQAQNGGFGVPETSTHFHNFHDAPETDGGPCRFFFRGQYYDYYRTMQTAGFDDPNTDPRERVLESQSTLWYHDHRVEHTAENVYKGLFGFHPASPHRQADRPGHGEALLRPLRLRRPGRRQAAGQRRPPAVPRGAEAPLSLPGPGRRTVALLRAVPHQSRQPEADDPLLRHRQRRQPPARAGWLPHVVRQRGPHRGGRARRSHHRLQEARARPRGEAPVAGEPPRARQRPRPAGKIL